MLKSDHSLYLTHICAYCLERPDISFDSVGLIFWETIEKLLGLDKPTRTSQLLNILANSILKLESKQLASNKESLQKLVTTCHSSMIKNDKNFPNTNYLLERFNFYRYVFYNRGCSNALFMPIRNGHYVIFLTFKCAFAV